MLRKLRGAVGTAVTWAIGWATSAFVVLSGPVLIWGNPDLFWQTIRPVTLLAGVSGLFGGAVFSTVLGTVHRNRRLGELSPLRMAAWGAGAGLLAPLALLGAGVAFRVPMQPGFVALLVAGIGGLGAATGGGTVKLAQLGQRDALGSVDLDDRLPPSDA